MSLLGLTIATALLSVAPPDDSTEAPAIVITAAPEPAPAPEPTLDPAVIVVPAPTGVPPIAPPSPVPTVPKIPRKPSAGIGLLAGSSMLFILGLSAHITAGVAQSGYCHRWDRRGYNTVHGCYYLTEPWMAHAGAAYAFGSSMVLAGIGSSALGKYDAWQSVYGDRRTRNAHAAFAVGGLLTAYGVGALIAQAFLLQNELNQFCTTYACEVERRQTYYALSESAALGFVAGVGLMSYGGSYRRHRARYGMPKNLSLLPQASPTMLGANASLRF